MPTNINFVEKLDAGCDTQVSFNLPKTLSLGTVKKSFDNNGLSEAEGCSYLALNTLNQAALLGKASLIINPSSFSENALYADLPANSTLGDLVFSRATDAWRTNSQGLIERTPWNLLRSSEQFDLPAWTKTRAGAGVNPVVTANAGIAPNGTNTADRVQFNCVGNTSADRSILLQAITIFVGTNYTASFYIKAFSAGEVGKQLRIVGEGTSIPSTIITLTADWTRVTITGSAASVITGNYIFETRGTFTSNTTADVLLWGAQLVEGSSSLEYFPTTDRQDVPRIDYSLGGCPNILLEPQRTNIVLYSQEFDNASWTKTDTTITANTTISPSGVQNADTMSLTVTTSRVTAPNTLSAGTYTISVWIRVLSGSGTMRFNLTIDGVNTNVIFSPTSQWERFTTTFTVVTSAAPISFRAQSFVGDVAIWGAQIETGSYPTSYIPTTNASVTRNADTITRNNIYTNGFITSIGGTWFLNLKNNIPIIRDGLESGIYIDSSSSGFANGFNIRNSLSSSVRVSISKWIAGAGTPLYATTANDVKIAIKWNGTTADIFENGVKVVSATSFAITNMEFLQAFGNASARKFISSIMLYPTPLSDAECITLTT